MRLLDTETGQFVQRNPEKTTYAILSHTWDDEGEQTYQELTKIQERYRLRSRIPVPKTRPASGTLVRLRELPFKILRHGIWRDRKLSPKIRHACAVARDNGYRYIWIDTCCIDKSSSSEITEAINSMYMWYSLAAVCYVYLADVPPREDHQAWGSAFRRSRWFGRGWTLQELIAPLSVEFLSADWAPIGSKHDLFELVGSITKIDHKALLHLEPLDIFSVAQRLSWAANRKTMMEEDRAYSLLGIFDIHMLPLYGEGDHAFRRLQEEIMQRIPDQSLFAWKHVYLSSQLSDSQNPDVVHTPKHLHLKLQQHDAQRNFLALSLDDFKGCGEIGTPCHGTIKFPSWYPRRIAYPSTPYGFCAQFPMIPLTRDLFLKMIPTSKDFCLEFGSQENQWYITILGCEHAQHPGHLLGRVCNLPSSQNNVKFVYAGYALVVSQQGESLCPPPDLFPLPPEFLESFHSDIELKTVYIRHPDYADLSPILRRKQCSQIKLVLVRDTHDALLSQGYSAEIHNPDLNHPTIHRLTLSNDSHMITLQFRHTLEDSGKQFIIRAAAKISGLCAFPDPDQEDCSTWTVSWHDANRIGWSPTLDRRRIQLAIGVKMVTVDLGMDFLGTGLYNLRVNVLNNVVASSL